MVTHKRYQNGLKLVVNEMESMMSVSVGIIVGAGSVLENANNNGISHFIEHVNFKGTERFSAFELSDAFDMIGSQVNAFTSKEITCYYVKSTVPSLERSFDLLSDLFLNSTYKDDELEKEKGVIIEEINMSNDIPEELCLDKLSESYFGNEGLGRTILGPAENVKNFGKSDIIAYKKRFYNADNMVVSFAGAISMEKAEELVDKYLLNFVSLSKSDSVEVVSSENRCGSMFTQKDIEQAHLAFAFDGIKYNDEKSDEFSLINTVLGAGMSSRLFQKVREEQGLCYTIYSFPSGYRNVGTLAIYSGLNADNVTKAYDTIINVVTDLKHGITKNEFERGKAQIVSSFAFGEESTVSQMMLYGKYFLFTDSYFDQKQKLENINALTLEQVNDSLKEMNFDRFSLSLVAKEESTISIKS